MNRTPDQRLRVFVSSTLQELAGYREIGSKWGIGTLILGLGIVAKHNGDTRPADNRRPREWADAAPSGDS